MQIEQPPPTGNPNLDAWLERLVTQLYFTLQGSDTWDPGSIADGDKKAKEITVTNAVLGDFAIASFSLYVADLILDAQVTAANKVTCVLANNTGGAIDLAEGTIRVVVFRRKYV